MSLRLISASDLEDVFLYGIENMAVLGDQELDAKVIEIIRQQPTIKAVPYYEIAQAILKVRGINKGFDEIPRQEVIDILWKLIDDKPKQQKGQEAADGL